MSLFSDVALEAAVNGASHAQSSLVPASPMKQKRKAVCWTLGPCSQQGSWIHLDFKVSQSPSYLGTLRTKPVGWGLVTLHRAESPPRTPNTVQ